MPLQDLPRMREAREARGLSQERAAELIGRERKSIVAYEDPLQDRLPRLDTALQLVRLYRVDLNYLVGKEKPNEERS